MADETLYVQPPSVRSTGAGLTDIAGNLWGDLAGARDPDDVEDPHSPWQVTRAARTLDRLWGNYVSTLSDTIGGHGEGLRKVADVYETRDEEAAAALGIVLPDDDPARPWYLSV